MSVGVPTQVAPENQPTPGSITGLMDALTAIQARVPDHPLLAPFAERLNLKRWRPDQADPPMLYNWMLTSSNERMDTRRVRDVVPISTRIGITYTDVGDRMGFVEAVADAYRATVDPTFWDGSRMPLTGMGAASTWAMRSAMQSFTDEVGGTPILGIEFIQTFWLDHAA